MKLSAVQKIENLHHHEGVEYEGEMPRVDVKLLEYWLIVFLAINLIEATRSNCPSYDAVGILVLRMI